MPRIAGIRARWWLLLIVIGIPLLLVAVLIRELVSSDLQARYLSRTASKMTWQLQQGPSSRIRFPGDGPYDQRLGYSKIPEFTRRLQDSGWTIERQARISIQMARVGDLGLNLPYHEKNQGGLTLLDEQGQLLYLNRYPERVYGDFSETPPVLRNALLFIENRELLNEQFPSKNPAVEWDRLGQAVLDKFYSMINPAHNVPGGSTLPTQIEKYRHSPDGVTLSMKDKLLQMASASLRAYLDGKNTLPTRQRIVRDYLNTVPLAAAPGFGEVNGVGDGLWAWYGLDFAHSNAALWRLETNPADAEGARAFKHALSLLVAERKPVYYLAKDRAALDRYTNVHLDLLADAGVISKALHDAALKVTLRGPNDRASMAPPLFVNQKASSSMRVKLAGMLGIQQQYDLGHLDLVAQSTLNGDAQQQVTDFLRGLSDPARVAAAGLYGERLFRPDNDLGKVIYSFTLYEKSPQGMLLRVQADNLNQPFDINQQTRLDLGSTSKFRTLVSYLEIVTQLREDYLKLPQDKLKELAQPRQDVIAQWVAEYLLSGADRSLSAMLEAAMGRRYSAAPEMFYTGGGEHEFANFNKDDNTRVMDLWDATRNSVNLVFIRLMRDIVRHFIQDTPGAASHVLDEAPSSPERRQYLLRFVDQEGSVFLRRFYQRHANTSASDMEEDLYQRVHQNLKRFTALFRYIQPDAGFSRYVEAVRQHLPATATMQESVLKKLFEQHAPGAYSLADRGYVTQIHPLEIWLVGYLRTHPKASFEQAVSDSAQQRVEVYDWLLASGNKEAQDTRIRSLMEVEAFESLLKDWKRLGYPFNNLTPSYATAIGSSGDRPAALAELMGIIVNDGVRLPNVSLQRLNFAVGTPYETHFRPAEPKAEVLFPKEIAQTIRKALGLVVQGGTAARLNGVIKDANGNPVPFGGKTGTGDHRYVRYGPGGQLLEARAVNRTATFVFYLGDRYFGTITALVPGRDAENYQFTSSLTAQILKKLLPGLQASLLPETLKVAAPAPGAASPASPSGTPAEAVSPAASQPRPAARRTPEPHEGTAHEAEPDKSGGGFPDSLDPVMAPATPGKPISTDK